MEEKFTNSDFEEFLQDQVRNHRMYPSDSVWRDINKKLHGDKKWPALTIAAFALLTATITICVYFTPKPNIFSLKNVEVPNKSINSNSNNVLSNLTPSFAQEQKNVNNNLSDNKVSVQQALSPVKVLVNTQVRKNQNNFGKAERKNFENELGNATDKKLSTQILEKVGDLTSERNNVISENSITLNDEKPEIRKSNKIMTVKTSQFSSKNELSIRDYDDKNMVDNFLKDHKEDVALFTSSKVKSVKHKFSYQIYAAPSISYRSLIEDRSILKGNNSGPVGLNYVADVNSVVRHKPGVGLEAGFSILYNLSNTFRIKTGFQFNVRQYSIEAFRSKTELASIALIENNRIDTINTFATYRTNNGYYSDELVNRYFQLAAPIGVEWQIIGNSKLQLNIAGSIQPTYLLNRNAYLLSANFKNYTENPDIIRRWNINSNIETFISFKVGDFKWQVGPQVRYQPYSTFIPQYPIKEHLMDYGFKIGVSKTFN